MEFASIYQTLSLLILLGPFDIRNLIKSPHIKELQLVNCPHAASEERVIMNIKRITAHVWPKNVVNRLFRPRVPELNSVVPPCRNENVRILWAEKEGVDPVRVPVRCFVVIYLV